MNTNCDILTQLREVLEVYEFGIIKTEDDEFLALQNIVSDSSQAIRFVTVVEDEFEVEFADEDIDLDFFSSLSIIAAIIAKNRIVAS